MALEAIVFPQDQLFGCKDLFNLVGSSGGFNLGHEFSKFDEEEDDDFYFVGNQTEISPLLLDRDYYYCYWNNINNSSTSISSDLNFSELQKPDDPSRAEVVGEMLQGGGEGGSARPARRRKVKSQKSKEEIENQRMTHITVERNRRKQMNEYLSILRSLMPDSYVQRGDQASIIGGAINFVKELEQQLHLLITAPQYSSSSSSPSSSSISLESTAAAMASHNNIIQSSVGDIEVSLADSHANLKIRCKKLPKQLLKIVSGLNSLRLTVLHLNVSTSHDQTMLYTLSLKVEEDCGVSTVDEIARAVYQLLCRIQEETFSI